MVKKGGGGASLRQSSDRRCSLSVTVTKLPRVGDVFVVHFFFFFFFFGRFLDHSGILGAFGTSL